MGIDKPYIVVFAGAGASYAVNAEHYPTTSEFLKRLPGDIKRNPFFSYATDFLDPQKTGGIDIEHVVGALSDLREFVEKASDVKTIESHFLRGGRLNHAVGLKNQNTDAFVDLVTQARPTISRLVDRINHCVYDFYATEPEPAELAHTWLPLLEPLVRQQRSRVEVFTTNYDINIESAAHILAEKDSAYQRLSPGYRQAPYKLTLDLAQWNGKAASPNGLPSGGLITKLHGSVRWVRQSDQIYVSAPAFAGSEERQVILYPGFKDDPAREPFAVFHAHLRRVLAQTQAIIFIGFAFRDEYLGRIFAETIVGDTAVVVIDPSSVTSAPATPEFRHIQKGFGVDAIVETLDILRPWIA